MIEKNKFEKGHYEMEKNLKPLSKRLMQRFLIVLFVAIIAYVGKELSSTKTKEKKNTNDKTDALALALIKIHIQFEKKKCIELQNQYWEDYKKTINEIQSLVPYEFNFSDTKNLVDQIYKYQKHIETLILEAKENSVNESLLNQNRLEQYKHALYLFESSHIRHKMEFIQCWEYGDGLSVAAREYVYQLEYTTSKKIMAKYNYKGKVEKEFKVKFDQNIENVTKDKKEFKKQINEISHEISTLERQSKLLDLLRLEESIDAHFNRRLSGELGNYLFL